MCSQEEKSKYCQSGSVRSGQTFCGPGGIHFDDIPATGLHLTIADQGWFPARDLAAGAPFRAQLFLDRRESRVFVEGRITGSLTLECDRCLEPYAHQLDEVFRLDLELAGPQGPAVEEIELDGTDMDTVLLPEPTIDICGLLRQQIFLLMPEKKLCSEMCHGICASCGAARNVEPCGCRQQVTNSPFAELRRKVGSTK